METAVHGVPSTPVNRVVVTSAWSVLQAATIPEVDGTACFSFQQSSSLSPSTPVASSQRHSGRFRRSPPPTPRSRPRHDKITHLLFLLLSLGFVVVVVIVDSCRLLFDLLVKWVTSCNFCVVVRILYSCLRRNCPAATVTSGRVTYLPCLISPEAGFGTFGRLCCTMLELQVK